MSLIDATSLLAAELTLCEGATPEALPDPLRVTPGFAIARDAFLLKLPNGLRFHYVRGAGVIVSRPAGVPDSDVDLFFNGSVHGAVAWLNGLVPLHASAVVHEGQLHAFTARSGGGKSTLAAALAAEGFEMFADDVIVLDLRSAGAPMGCSPHKRLKLWQDAVARLGNVTGDRVRPGIDKFYAAPASRTREGMLPLAHLHLLRDHEEETRVTPVTGSDKVHLARAALYRPHFGAAVLDAPAMFTALTRIAALDMSIFERPRREEDFAASIALIADRIRNS